MTTSNTMGGEVKVDGTVVGTGGTIIVDDPHGFVVPSEGVVIVGRGHRHGLQLALAASRIINMGAERAAELMPKVVRPEPRIGKKTGVKQRLKGLRP